MSEELVCKHRYEDGSGVCSRVITSGTHQTCIFHRGSNHTTLSVKEFWREFIMLLKSKDGDWREFRFPNINRTKRLNISFDVNLNHAFFKSTTLQHVYFLKDVSAKNINHSECFKVKHCTFYGEVDFNYSFFNKFYLYDVRFEKLFRALECKFNNDFTLDSVRFCKSARFARSEFTGKFLYRNTEVLGRHLDLLNTKFFDDFYMSGEIVGRAVFFGSVFCGEALFQRVLKKVQDEDGNVLMEKQLQLFCAEVDLSNVKFDKPERVVFDCVKMAGSKFQTTNLSKVVFIGNDWFQEKLKRNGLNSEVSYLDHSSTKSDDRKLKWIEDSYRKIRISMEEVKDFNLANDFFIGEMEAKRRQLPSLKKNLTSILALYNLFSKYGTSPVRCIVWFLGAVFLYAALLLGMNSSGIIDVSFSPQCKGLFVSSLQIDWDAVGKSVIYALQTMTLQKEKVQLVGIEHASLVFNFAKTLFSILGPVILAGFGLALRTRIKRN